MSRDLYRGDAFRVVRGASGFRGSAERLVIVLQVYLDDSGTSGLPIITMAGFTSHMEQWEAMEPVWDEILNRYEVPVLHAKEFHDTKGAFKNWKKVKKRTLAKELFAAAHERMLGASVTVRRKDIEEYKKANIDFANMSPIGMCFSAIMYRVLTNPKTAEASKDGVSFLIESGNKNNSGIEQYFHKLSTWPIFEGRLRSITFIPKQNCRAIQIADFLAFHSRRLMRNHDRFSGRLTLPPCPYIQIIKEHVNVWQIAGYGKPKAAANVRSVPDLASLHDLMKAKNREPN